MSLCQIPQKNVRDLPGNASALMTKARAAASSPRLLHLSHTVVATLPNGRTCTAPRAFNAEVGLGDPGKHSSDRLVGTGMFGVLSGRLEWAAGIEWEHT